MELLRLDYLSSMIAVKEALFKSCLELVNDRILRAEEGLKSAQDAANNETKSSAGDKYETGRAMMHLEKEKLSSQLSEALKMKKVLDLMKETSSPKVELGSLVKTNAATYYLAISAGQLKVDGRVYFAISPVSPIGQQLMGKKKGELITFAGKTQTIEEVS